MKLPRPFLGLAAASTLLLSGLLSGCGVAGTGFSPGIAAEVGDREISIDRVHELAASYCDAITPQLEGQVLPNRYLTSGVAGQLALAEAAQQLGEEHGVEPSEQYDSQVSQLRTAVAGLTRDQQAAVVEVDSAGSLVSDVVIGVGEVLAEEEGLSDPSREQVAQLGNQALAEWIEENDVDLNPRYGIELRNGQPVEADTSTSVAVGDTATAAMADSPDQEYAASLPDSQRCG